VIDTMNDEPSEPNTPCIIPQTSTLCHQTKGRGKQGVINLYTPLSSSIPSGFFNVVSEGGTLTLRALKSQ